MENKIFIIGATLFIFAVIVFGVYRYEKTQRINEELDRLLTLDNELKEFCRSKKLSDCEGKYLTIDGTFSDLQQQRMFYPSGMYSHISYLDTRSDGQIVLYTVDPINVAVGTKLEVVGKVVKVSSEPALNVKAGDGYIDYQFLVDSWKQVK